MRVSVVRGGGFGGLVRTTVADTERLAPGDGERLTALVQQAGLLESSSTRDSEDPGPDRFTYAVRVEHKGSVRETGFSEQTLPEPVRNLISWVRTVDGHEDRIEPPWPPSSS